MTETTVTQEQGTMTPDEQPSEEVQHERWQGEDAPDECIACGKPWPCEGADDEARELAETLEGEDPYRYLSERASRLVAYRDHLQAKLHESLQLVDEDAGLTAQDLEGVRVITHKDLELALRLTPFPPATSRHATLRTPAVIDLDGVCHDCGEVTPLSLAVDTKYISDDKKHEMQVTAKGTHGSHRHGQMVLSAPPGRDPQQQSMEDVLEAGDDDDADDEPEDEDVDDGDLLPGEDAE